MRGQLGAFGFLYQRVVRDGRGKFALGHTQHEDVRVWQPAQLEDVCRQHPPQAAQPARRRDRRALNRQIQLGAEGAPGHHDRLGVAVHQIVRRTDSGQHVAQHAERRHVPCGTFRVRGGSRAGQHVEMIARLIRRERRVFTVRDLVVGLGGVGTHQRHDPACQRAHRALARRRDAVEVPRHRLSQYACRQQIARVGWRFALVVA